MKYQMKYHWKGMYFVLLAMGVLFILSSCNHQKKNESFEKEKKSVKKDSDLPINKSEKKRAKKECLAMMNLIKNIYEKENKDDFCNMILSKKAEDKIINILKQAGEPVTCKSFCHNMLHYNKMEEFLLKVKKGKASKIVLYELHLDGGIGRNEFTFDGKDMYSLYTNSIWNEENKPIIVGNSYTKIKSWNYSKKGWFSYELSVPKLPEVSEIVNGTVMVRVKPIKDIYRTVNQRYLLPISYQGNNLFTSNWNKESMEVLDYNGLFEFLYNVKYQKKFKSKLYENGIPQQEFEELMLEHLPVSKEQVRKYSAYEKEKGVYSWLSLGCGNYVLNEFGSTFPEIVKIEKNKDGTSIITVDAVCDSLGKEQLFQHKLKVRFLENGGIQYISNVIVKNNADWLFNYQFRIANP